MGIIGAVSGALVVGSFAANPAVRLRTDLGVIDLVLYQDVAPATVVNFLGYVNRGDYDNSFFHRSLVNFIIQGGGWKVVNNAIAQIPLQAAVVNEFNVSNTRGTIAMAKVAGNPNSATNQWFFNTANNASNLDAQNGGFTVFGAVMDASSLTTMDVIAAVPVFNWNTTFPQIPLKNFTSGVVQDANLVHVISVKVIPELEISRLVTGDVELKVTGAPSTVYQVQSSTTLLAGSFTPFVTVTTNAAGVVTSSDAVTGAVPQKFYRLVLP